MLPLQVMSVGCPTIAFPRGVFREWVSETCPLLKHKKTTKKSDPGFEFQQYLRTYWQKNGLMNLRRGLITACI